jgi:malate dehydrogenase (oxaloacetate-decarboxylating)(NADP+)
LDVRAKQINEEMKFAASKALAALAKEDVPDSVIRAYGGEPIKFGREYIIPSRLIRVCCCGKLLQLQKWQ